MKIIYDEKFHNVKEAAEILGISTTTVHNYVKNGTLKAVKIGGLWHVKEAVIKAYLDVDDSEADNIKEK
jgi:excisionase family DNA binding protein